MPIDDPQPPKLNLFALPSQTTLIFAGILIVICAPLVVSLTSLRFIVALPLLPVAVLLFTLWDFLVEPERLKRRFAAEPLPASAQTLLARIARLSREIGLNHPPRTLQATKSLRQPFAFGTWRRHFLLLPDWAAAEFDRILDTPGDPNAAHVDVILRHELAHIVNQDVWLTMFARSLLRMTVLTLLTYWFALLWQPFIYLVLLQTFTDWMPLVPPVLFANLPEIFQQFVRSPPRPPPTFVMLHVLEISMMLLPIIAGALILWLRDWRFLLQARELYADARVAAWLHDIKAVLAARPWFAVVSATARSAGGATQRRPGRLALSWPTWLNGLRTPLPLSWSVEDVAPKSLFPSLQPSVAMRRQVLQRPETVAGDAKTIGRRAGVIVLLLYLVTMSLLSPVRQGLGSGVAIGVGFAFLALGLIPGALSQAADERAVAAQTRRSLVSFILAFCVPISLLILFNVGGMIFRPEFLDILLYAISGAIPKSFAPVLDYSQGYAIQVLIGSLAVYLVAAPLLLYLFLRLDVWIKLRLLEWYAAPWVEKRTQALILGITLGLAGLIFFGVMPLLELLAFPFILTPDAAVLFPAALCWFLALAIALWFWRSDRRFHGHCGNCGEQTTTLFRLGAVCSHCGKELRPKFRKDATP